MDKFCRRTSKRCFSSKNEARRGMVNLSDRLRIYNCPFCQCWHLTKSISLNKLYHEEEISIPEHIESKKRKTGKKILMAPDGTVTYIE